VAYLTANLATAREAKESHKTLSQNIQEPDWRQITCWAKMVTNVTRRSDF